MHEIIFVRCLLLNMFQHKLVGLSHSGYMEPVNHIKKHQSDFHNVIQQAVMCICTFLRILTIFTKVL